MNTRNIISRVAALLVVLLAGACEKVDIPREELTGSYERVYMAAAARNPNEVVLKMADTVYHVTYGASVGGYSAPVQDIEIQFVVDSAKVQAYNETNNTSYSLLPASCYELEQAHAVIPAGAVATEPLSIRVNPASGMELFREYLLPVSVSADTKINASLQTAYYIIKASLDFADFPEYDRSGWSILGASSEEPAEGATNGGLAIHAIDGATSTFWHTKWDGGYAPPPHWLAIDMGQTQTLHGLAFTGRQSSNNGKPHTVEVETSGNGTDWAPAGTLTLANSNAQQKFFLTAFPQCRYIRITVSANYGNVEYTHLAELGAF